MEWLDLGTKLGLSATSTLLVGACWALWKKLESKETKHEAVLVAKDARYEAMVASKDQKIEALHERLTQTLIAISERSDDD